MSASSTNNNNYMKSATQLQGEASNDRTRIAGQLERAANSSNAIEDACEKISITLKETFTELHKIHGKPSKKPIQFTFFLGVRDATVNTCFSHYWEKVRSSTSSPVHSDLIAEVNLVYLANIAQQARSLTDDYWYCQTEIGTLHLYEKEIHDEAPYIHLRFLSIYLMPQGQQQQSFVPSDAVRQIINPQLYSALQHGIYEGKKPRILAEGHTNILPTHTLVDPKTGRSL